MPPKKRIARKAPGDWVSQSPPPSPSPSPSPSPVRKLSIGTQTEIQNSAAPSRAPTRPKKVTSKDQMSMIRRGVRRASELTHVQAQASKERYIIARPGVAGDIPLPLANEKACQATPPVLKELQISPPGNPVLFEVLNIPEMSVEQMRKERIHNTEVNRLKYLMDIVNADMPPHWNLASSMWREIDYLEDSIEAYQKQLAK